MSTGGEVLAANVTVGRLTSMWLFSKAGQAITTNVVIYLAIYTDGEGYKTYPLRAYTDMKLPTTKKEFCRYREGLYKALRDAIVPLIGRRSAVVLSVVEEKGKTTS